jgi:hypothetical protein
MYMAVKIGVLAEVRPVVFYDAPDKSRLRYIGRHAARYDEPVHRDLVGRGAGCGDGVACQLATARRSG